MNAVVNRAATGSDRDSELVDESPGTSSGWRELLPHAVAGFVILLLVIAIAGTRGYASADEVVAHEQVELLAEGRWAQPLQNPGLDPTGRWEPLDADNVSGATVVPYLKHPAFPVMLLGGDTVAGRFGRFAVVALGAVTAAAILGLGVRQRGGRAPVGFWLALAGTPLFFHGLVLWAHSWGFAAAAAAIVAADAASREKWKLPRALAVLTPAVVLATLLRSESLVFFPILAVVYLGIGMWQRQRALQILGVVIGASVVVTTLLEGVLRGWILPDAAAEINVPAEALSTLDTRITLIKTWLLGLDGSMAMIPYLAGFAMLTWSAYRIRQRESVPPIVVALASAGYALGALTGANMGFFITMPLVIVALVAIPTRDTLARVVLVTTPLYFLAIVLTSYDNAGGGDWGGRYLFLAAAPLVLLAGSSLAQLWKSSRPLIIAAGLASVVMCVSIATETAVYHHRTVGVTEDLREDISVLRDGPSIDGADMIVVVSDSRISRLLAEDEPGFAVFLVNDGESMNDFDAALEADPVLAESKVAVVQFLSEVATPDEWRLIDELRVIEVYERASP